MADQRSRGAPKSERFARAIAAIDAAHAGDPRKLETDLGSRPLELAQAERAFAWVRRLRPGASEALLLAARAHHLRRWEIPRSRYPAGRAGYLRWRKQLQQRHAQGAAALLEPLGYDTRTLDRVADLIRKRGIGRDDEVQVLEDALCLVFFETQLAAFAAEHPATTAASVLRKTLAKMSPRGRAVARELALPARVRSLLAEALETCDAPREGAADGSRTRRTPGARDTEDPRDPDGRRRK
ncbi:MAG: DUF4202 domain-containing protein [Myxococcota bacterium]